MNSDKPKRFRFSLGFLLVWVISFAAGLGFCLSCCSSPENGYKLESWANFSQDGTAYFGWPLVFRTLKDGAETIDYFKLAGLFVLAGVWSVVFAHSVFSIRSTQVWANHRVILFISYAFMLGTLLIWQLDSEANYDFRSRGQARWVAKRGDADNYHEYVVGTPFKVATRDVWVRGKPARLETAYTWDGLGLCYEVLLLNALLIPLSAFFLHQMAAGSEAVRRPNG